MAIDFSKYNFFSRLNARARVFVLLGVVVGVVLLIYLGTLYFSGGNTTIGPSRVAAAPRSLQSVPGGTLTAEYSKALQQANIQAAQQAQISGGSAVPTLMNYGGQTTQTTVNTNCIICADQSTNVKYNIDDWVRQGKLAPEVGSALQALADKNVSVDEYAAELDRLVKEGKLTPEQARALLEQYKKQHTNALLQDSAKTMDDLIKSGKLPLEVANQLLEAQKNKLSPAEYAAMLQEMVRQGKISPEVAAQLLAQYSQQHAKQVIDHSIALLHQMARAGQIIPEIEKELVDLETRMVPLDVYSATLQRYLAAGKITPAVAGKILDEYKAQKASIGPSGSIDLMIKKAEAAAYGEINDLVRTGKMAPEIGEQLSSMIQKNVPFDLYVNTVNQLGQQGKLPPEIVKLKIADYKAVKGLRDMSEKLGNLQANNATNASYMEELKRQVQAGIITPEEAAQLLQEYQASTAKTPIEIQTAGPTTEAFTRLQQRVAEGATTTEAVPTTDQFAVAQGEVATQNMQDSLSRIEALQAAMTGQAGQLISAWQPVTMVHKAGIPDTPETTKTTTTSTTSTTAPASAADQAALAAAAPSLIKAGTVLFAVLDTTANSDYPDSPVMATIVDGPFKGAKLLGKLVTTKGVSGQMDRISLNFTLMNVEAWPKAKTITAYGIDPDTARTVMASHVDYHYLQRFGAMMATSFLQGYGNAIAQSSSTSTTGIFGTSTTYPELSPTSKLLSALGQMGQTVGAATANWINIPPTVKVDAGVGLGILFMSDVT